MGKVPRQGCLEQIFSDEVLHVGHHFDRADLIRVGAGVRGAL